MERGHQNLIEDLEILLVEARNFEFHDFKYEKYATPKVELAGRLETLRANVINGKYDN